MSVIEVATAEELLQLNRESTSMATVRLAPGEYHVHLELRRPMRLTGPDRNEAPAILRGEGRGPVITISDAGLDLTLESLVIVNGVATMGAGVAVHADARLHMLHCRLQGNLAGFYGGGAVYISGGEAIAQNCVFEGNKAQQGGAWLIDDLAHAQFENCSFVGNSSPRGGALRIREGARVKCLNCHFSKNKGGTELSEFQDMWISGTRTRTPELHLTSTTVEGNIRNALPHPGTIIAERCKLPDSLAGDPEFRDLGHNIFIQS